MSHTNTHGPPDWALHLTNAAVLILVFALGGPLLAGWWGGGPGATLAAVALAGAAGLLASWAAMSYLLAWGVRRCPLCGPQNERITP